MAKQAILLTDEIVPPPALIRAGLEALPAIIRAQSRTPSGYALADARREEFGEAAARAFALSSVQRPASQLSNSTWLPFNQRTNWSVRHRR